MPDMLVKLYELPPLEPVLEAQRQKGIDIRRGLAPEKNRVLAWVGEHFSDYWVSECDVAFTRLPVSCFIAVQDNTILGFACYDTAARGFFGPTGVDEHQRGRGIGAALLLMTLHGMLQIGYGYAIIGAVGPADFYTRVAGATVIPDSTPGMYRGLLPD
jgi:GNAT superfamily N-acetyltransferase